jgi:16S rRNA (uracil1498-N3)-methyltransferase
MADRYFVESPISGSLACLDGSEAHHLAHVMRARVGDEVELFDGTGATYGARIERIGRSEVELSILSRADVDRELACDITLAVSLPKGDRQRWLVEKATELGVRRLVPCVTARGVAQPVENAVARLRRVVIESSKQCRRNRLMEIVEPVRFLDFAATAPNDAVRFVAHPTPRGDGDTSNLLREHSVASLPLVAAIGPEGGFTDEELQMALDAGWKCVRLGPRILRVETAAIAVAAWAAIACSEGGR